MTVYLVVARGYEHLRVVDICATLTGAQESARNDAECDLEWQGAASTGWQSVRYGYLINTREVGP